MLLKEKTRTICSGIKIYTLKESKSYERQRFKNYA